MDHLKALIELAARPGRARRGACTRSPTGATPRPSRAPATWTKVEGWLEAAGGRIAAVTGRYFAMDRDKREERIAKAIDAHRARRGRGRHADSAVQAVKAAYERGETDEFVEPTLVGEEGTVRDGDAVLFFNFRPDRARELTEALNAELDRATRHADAVPGGLGLPGRVPAGRARGHAGLHAGRPRASRQLHVAETEKYAHVTYFFNGGEETPYEGEERELVDSPRDVPTYDHKPEMSARAAADAFVEAWATATTASASSTSPTRTWSATPA